MLILRTLVLLIYFLNCVWSYENVSIDGVPDLTNITVVSVLEKSQLQTRLAAGYLECRALQDNITIPSPYCPPVFDGLICWKATPANNTAYEPCPDFIDGYELDLKAEKICTSNGTWYKYDHVSLQSNYSTCIDLKQFKWEITVAFLYESGFIISLIALVLALIIYQYFKSLRCPRITLHKNLFASFALSNIMYIIYYETIMGNPMIAVGNSLYCRGMDILINYFLLASYMWMLCEGFYLHTILVCAFTNEHALLKYLTIFGWTSPIFFVFIYSILRATSDNIADYGYCWSNHGNYFRILVYTGAASLALNLIFLINIIRVVVVKYRTGPGSRQPSLGMRQAIRAVFLLIPLLGLHYLATPYRPPEGHPLEWLYDIVSVIATAYQGLAVAILFCFCNREVIEQFKRQFRRSRNTHINSCTVTTASVRYRPETRSMIQVEENQV